MAWRWMKMVRDIPAWRFGGIKHAGPSGLAHDEHAYSQLLLFLLLLLSLLSLSLLL